ncbi:MAG TPA: 3-hydroxyisobutyrate dehydrogenase [Alphaproteobacteria bacterium]|nr:3-hydroxyisobutyrate dehydrogenase [Alphaproteobacteria bacterium]
MSRIGFIGLGNMGGPMMRNLLKAGHQVKAFDLSKTLLASAKEAGAELAADPGEAASGVDAVITMLPAGQHVRSVYLDERGVLSSVGPNTLLVDCSTIDVESARTVSAAAAKRALDMVDAPVSGGVAGAAAGTLTFMVGGSDRAFARAEPLLKVMGKAIVHAGPSGNGQAAKICNNMMLGIQMISVAEGFALAEKLGLSAAKLFEISAKASGQCWSLTNYCPEPGLVPTAPSNRNFQPGFTAAMMLKDLRLAQQAAASAGAATPLGAEAASLFALFAGMGRDALDFSAIIQMIKGKP